MITLTKLLGRSWEESRQPLNADLDTLTLAVNQANAALVNLTYSTGLWRPLDASGAALTFSSNFPATWLKIGPMVYVIGDVVYPTTANALQAKIGGLPFPFPSTSEQGLLVSFATAPVVVFALMQGEIGQSINLYQSGAGAAVNILNSDLSTKVFRVSGWYQATA